MDILLENGDLTLTPAGEYVYVSGIDDALQKAILCAKIRKGSFIYNKNLGSELRGVDPESSVAKNTIELLLKEALMEVDGYVVRVLSVSRIQGNRYQMTIEIESENDMIETVVEFIADL